MRCPLSMDSDHLPENGNSDSSPFTVHWPRTAGYGLRTTDYRLRTMDKLTETLVDALKLALAEPGEQPLFKSGKLAGLFASRVGVNAEAAARALEERLLEVVRTE